MMDPLNKKGRKRLKTSPTVKAAMEAVAEMWGREL